MSRLRWKVGKVMGPTYFLIIHLRWWSKVVGALLLYYYIMEIVGESSGCSSVLYYEKLLFWECIKIIGYFKKKNCIQLIGTEGV